MAFYYVYPPNPYDTAYISQTFPEHHYPFEHTRQRLGNALKPLRHPHENEIHSPRLDARETLEKFYIDVELPGLSNKQDLKLKWINSRTVLLEAKLTRPPLQEELEQEKAIPEAPKEQSETPQVEDGPKEAAKPEENHPLVHVTISERRLGTYSKAFTFPVDIDSAALTATLQYGLLRMVVPKVPHEKVHQAHVEVEHNES